MTDEFDLDFETFELLREKYKQKATQFNKERRKELDSAIDACESAWCKQNNKCQKREQRLNKARERLATQCCAPRSIFFGEDEPTKED